MDEKGEKHPVIMGSYGIGPGRVMGTVVEVFSDEKGIVWPESIAPFAAHLVEVKSDSSEVRNLAEKIYNDLQKADIEVLYDDRRDASAGEKFADSDLIGIPWRIVISAKTMEQGRIEVKNRKTGEVKMVEEEELVKLLRSSAAAD